MSKIGTYRLVFISPLLLNCCDEARADIKIVDPHYTLSLSGDWTEEPSTDSEQHTLVSETRAVHVVTSAMGIKARRSQTKMIADNLVKLRLRAEAKAAQIRNLKLVIVEPIVVRQPWGHAVAYYGSDDRGRQFNYSGSVTPTAVISIYGECWTTEKKLGAIMKELIDGFEFAKSAK